MPKILTKTLFCFFSLFSSFSFAQCKKTYDFEIGVGSRTRQFRKPITLDIGKVLYLKNGSSLLVYYHTESTLDRQIAHGLGVGLFSKGKQYAQNLFFYEKLHLNFYENVNYKQLSQLEIGGNGEIGIGYSTKNLNSILVGLSFKEHWGTFLSFSYQYAFSVCRKFTRADLTKCPKLWVRSYDGAKYDFGQ